MEVTKLVRRGDEGTSVNQDAAELWSNLEPGICDMIWEKLPPLERLRLRVVCKDWNSSALKRVERKPYFVIIFRSAISSQYVNGLVVYDVVSKSLSFEPLPFKLHCKTHGNFHLAPFAVEGLIFTDHPTAPLASELWSEDCLVDVRKNQWCVYNIHTRTTHLLPRAPGCRDGLDGYFCGMMVDTSIKPYTFKLVVSYSTGEQSEIYDSATRLWSSHPKSKPNSNSSKMLLPYKFSNRYFCMWHKGCMYMCGMRAVRGVCVYSIEEDQWSELSGSPFRGEKRTYLGAWDDRIFAVLHDAGAKSVTVWELIDATQQEWVEYASCSKAQYEHLMEHDYVFDYCNCCECDIVSFFSEEYVLIHNWHLGRSYALVLLNLKTREWEPVPSIPHMIDETGGEEWECYFCDMLTLCRQR